MSQHDFTELKEQYPEIIKQMPQEFTSHQFILELAQQNQGLYIDALNAYRNNVAPFQAVHGVLSRSLHEFDDLVEDLGEIMSEDIWRHSNSSHKWQKK